MISRVFARFGTSLRLSRGLVRTNVRAFSSGGELQVAKAKSKLSKALLKELKFEQENFQRDETVQKYLKENGYTMVDREDFHEIELRKRVGDMNVLVVFQARPPQLDEGQEGEGQEQNPEQQQGEQEQDQEGQPGDYADFTVYLRREGEKNSLVVECTSFDSEINVNYINVIPDVEAHRKLSRFDRSQAYYPGPEFNSLDERVQTSFIEYIRGYGINEELAVFVEHVSLEKEQRLYMKWLEATSEFLGKE
eukprot:TRINITY_DN2836_c0_g1_i1.p1 TRINITY_DN2836_c0_g1~~TRINITY_DN2836_c0_g1_i1.p1  ORF type:complete len:250 (+),score=95.07 TRINITY_DN2836_c0_g1_i1:138-887(+)